MGRRHGGAEERIGRRVFPDLGRMAGLASCFVPSRLLRNNTTPEGSRGQRYNSYHITTLPPGLPTQRYKHLSLMIIYYALTGGAGVKCWSVTSFLSSLVVVQTTCSGLDPLIGPRKGFRLRSILFVSPSPGRRTKRHPQSCSTQTRGRLYGPEFPPTSIRDNV